MTTTRSELYKEAKTKGWIIPWNKSKKADLKKFLEDIQPEPEVKNDIQPEPEVKNDLYQEAEAKGWRPPRNQSKKEDLQKFIDDVKAIEEELEKKTHRELYDEVKKYGWFYDFDVDDPAPQSTRKRLTEILRIFKGVKINKRIDTGNVLYRFNLGMMYKLVKPMGWPLRLGTCTKENMAAFIHLKNIKGTPYIREENQIEEELINVMPPELLGIIEGYTREPVYTRENTKHIRESFYHSNRKRVPKGELLYCKKNKRLYKVLRGKRSGGIVCGMVEPTKIIWEEYEDGYVEIYEIENLKLTGEEKHFKGVELWLAKRINIQAPAYHQRIRFPPLY